MTSKPESADPELLAAHDLAIAALCEVTPPQTIGEPVGYSVEDDGVVSLRFENRLAGYPGWFWTVSLARVADAAPTVLEVELLPGADALVAPDWVPWAVRLADYTAAQSALAEAADAVGEDAEEDDDFDGELDADLDEDADDDDADVDDDDLDEVVVSSRLHAGDVDGVDIDELDDSIFPADADSDDADSDDSEVDDDDDSDDAEVDSDDEDDEDDRA
ncbi:DUF3027 domain-containing protein [Microbacterium sp. P05]|uniref:DUF3027 domain-containing protein n=1 Tax=Microbacterium sp. P05 TaxID=3366948 RepID=UPI0037477234